MKIVGTIRIAAIWKRGIVGRRQSKSGTEESEELIISCNLAGLGTQHRLQRPAQGTGEAGNALVAIVRSERVVTRKAITSGVCYQDVSEVR